MTPSPAKTTHIVSKSNFSKTQEQKQESEKTILFLGKLFLYIWNDAIGTMKKEYSR